MPILHIDFTEPSPAPSQYKVRYKLTTDSTWTELTIAGPPPFDIGAPYSIDGYDVEVYSDCGSGIYSSAGTTIAPYYECAEYEFTNTNPSSPETVEYYPCGTIDYTVTVNVPSSATVGPFCLTVGSTEGTIPFVFNAGPSIVDVSSGPCSSVPTPTPPTP